MASFERVSSWVDIHQNSSETTENPDENTPLSPEEGHIMRNHSKLSTKIYSPARKHGKSTGFTVHGSPCTTKLVSYIDLTSICFESSKGIDISEDSCLAFLVKYLLILCRR